MDSEVIGFAPDGSFYYKTQTSLGRLYNGEVDLETGKVLVPPAPVTTRYTGPPSQPTWSPDGRNLLYISRPGVRRSRKQHPHDPVRRNRGRALSVAASSFR